MIAASRASCSLAILAYRRSMADFGLRRGLGYFLAVDSARGADLLDNDNSLTDWRLPSISGERWSKCVDFF